MKIAKTKSKFIICIAICFLTFCNGRSPSLGRIEESYTKSKLYFGEELTSHFPESISEFSGKFYYSQDTRRSHPGMYLKIKLSKREVQSLLSELENKSVVVYNSEDSCLLLIDSHLTEKNRLKYDKNLRMGPQINDVNKECHQEKLPVPKFWKKNWKENNTTQIGLDPGTKLYVLEAKSGIFLDENMLPNGKYTPFGWKHGYTKGIAVNEAERRVIYWFDIW
jgi:hypothetical protein